MEMLLTFFIALPALTACFIALLRPKDIKIIAQAVSLSALLELTFVCLLIPAVLERGTVSALGMFTLDPLGAWISLITALVAFFVTLYSVGYLEAEMEKGIIGPRRIRQYFFLLELFLLAMGVAVVAENPLLMWIAIEATTLSTAFLITFYNKPSAIEAGWKYLILNSLGLLLGLLGTLLFMALPEESLAALNWQTLRELAPEFNPLAVKVAFVFILVGYGTKVGLVPFHTWKPDTYSKAPTPIVALLSGVLLNVAFLALLRFKGVADSAVGASFSSSLFLFFGAASVFLAALIIFIQKNYKRLLAYSGIEHAGILALGFGFGGSAIFASLLHMFYHGLVKALLFMAAGNIFLRYSSTKMEQVKGLFRTLPFSGVVFFGGFIAIVGLPPFGLFLTKLLILSEGIVEHPYLVGSIIFALAVVFFGFFRHVTGMFFGAPEPQIEDTKSFSGESNQLTTLPLLLLALLILVLSWYLPGDWRNLLEEAAATLTNIS